MSAFEHAINILCILPRLVVVITHLLSGMSCPYVSK